MASDVRTADIQDLLKPYQVRYEVCPYYVMSEQRTADGSLSEQRYKPGST
jgi:hypothetical protein